MWRTCGSRGWGSASGLGPASAARAALAAANFHNPLPVVLLLRQLSPLDLHFLLAQLFRLKTIKCWLPGNFQVVCTASFVNSIWGAWYYKGRCH
jgi:hypothetical protein